jgi:CRISP-associated protein Cas1
VPDSAVARVFARDTTDPRVIVADGHGVKVHVTRGQLVIEDGTGRTRRTRDYPRSDRTLERIIVLAADGMVTLDAVSWCADHGIALIGACRDELGFTVRLLAGAPMQADPRLSRALVLAGRGAPHEAMGAEITRGLLNVKLQGQGWIARHVLGDAEVAGMFDVGASDLDRATAIDQLVALEGNAASIYWTSWSGRVTPAWAAGGPAVPETWRQPFVKRASPLHAGSHQHAADPVNALLNFAYGVAETTCVIACWEAGLDPCLGLSHVPAPGRYSLALDLVETLRPECDKLVLSLAGALRAEWFHEVRTGPYAGSCRVLPPLTHVIAEQMGGWDERAVRNARKIASALTASAASGGRPVKAGLGSGSAGQADALVPDDLWVKVGPLIPAQPRRATGRPPADPRRVVAALMYCEVLGRPRASANAGAGLSHQVMSRYLKLWRADGTWERLLPVLAEYAARLGQSSPATSSRRVSSAYPA